MNEIEKELHKLKLPGMANCWTSLCETHRADKLSFRDGLQLLLQTEQETRKTNRIARLLKEAAFCYPASLEELDYDAERGVDATTVANLGTCDYIRTDKPLSSTARQEPEKLILQQLSETGLAGWDIMWHTSIYRNFLRGFAWKDCKEVKCVLWKKSHELICLYLTTLE